MKKMAQPEIIWKDRKRHLGLPISFTRYSLSEDRLFNSVGFLTVTENETLLYRIQDLTVRRSLGQRIFGVGTVVVSSSDPSQPVLELKNIRHVREVKELLHSNIEAMKTKKGVRASELVGPHGGMPDHNHPNADLDGDGIPDDMHCDCEHND